VATVYCFPCVLGLQVCKASGLFSLAAPDGLIQSRMPSWETDLAGPLEVVHVGGRAKAVLCKALSGKVLGCLVAFSVASGACWGSAASAYTGGVIGRGIT